MSVGDAIEEAVRPAVICEWRVEDCIPGQIVGIGPVDNLYCAVLGAMSVGDCQCVARIKVLVV